jgi:hypothetical protein
MHYGHILRKDLRAFGKLKFWSLLFFHLIFSLMRLTFYLSTCCILGLSKNNFQFCFKFNFKMNQILVKTHRYTFSRWTHELLVAHAHSQALVLSKKTMHYGQMWRRWKKSSPRVTIRHK